MDLTVLQTGSSEPTYDSSSEDTGDRYPVGFDQDKFNRGRRFFVHNLPQCMSAMACSLVCGLCVRNLLDVLVETGVTRKPWDSIMRYINTFIHILKWHYGNVWDPKSSARESIRKVRKMHNNARKLMDSKDHSMLNDNIRDGTRQADIKETPVSASDREASRSVTHVNQYDMSLVQCGFIGIILMYPRQFGIRCSERDLDDYVYFWRCIGFLLGIKDHNNICVEGYDRAYSICKTIEQEVLLPSFYNPSPEFYPMAKAFTDGVNELVRCNVSSPESMFAVGLTTCGEKIRFKMSLGDNIRFYVHKMFVLCFLYVPGYRWLSRKIIERGFRCDQFT